MVERSTTVSMFLGRGWSLLWRLWLSPRDKTADDKLPAKHDLHEPCTYPDPIFSHQRLFWADLHLSNRIIRSWGYGACVALLELVAWVVECLDLPDMMMLESIMCATLGRVGFCMTCVSLMNLLPLILCKDNWNAVHPSRSHKLAINEPSSSDTINDFCYLPQIHKPSSWIPSCFGSARSQSCCLQALSASSWMRYQTLHRMHWAKSHHVE